VLVAYFGSFLTGECAAQIQSVAVAWTVYQIAHRPLDLGLVGLALFIPSLLLVPVTGIVADRFDRRAIVLLAAGVEVVARIALFWLVLRGHVRLELVLGILLVTGTASAFGATAERTILINLVDEERYMRMTALYSAMRELVVIGGPAVGGVLVAISPAIALATAAGMLGLSMCAFAFVRLRRAISGEGSATWQSALEGFRFVRAQPALLGAISLDLFAVLFGGSLALLPVYASDILHVGATGFGILRSSVAVGALAAGILLHRYPPVRHIGTLLLATVAGFGLATIVFAFSRTLWFSIVALAVAGAFDMISVVIRNGLVQLNTPNDMLGRVSAIEMVFIGASNELGDFESGALAQAIGAVGSVAAGGIATVLIVALWAIAFPTIARTDRLTGEA